MTEIAGILLAGGLARRMGGGDKTLLPLAGRPLLAHCIERLTSQCAPLVINANGDLARFASFGVPVVADDVPGFAGPLAGILAGLDFLAAHSPTTTHAVSVAGDTPFIPTDLVARLEESLRAARADISVAGSGGRMHPVVALWPISIRDDLREALVKEDERKIDRFTARYNVATVEWPTVPLDPFFNANTVEDLAEGERIVTSAQAGASA